MPRRRKTDGLCRCSNRYSVRKIGRALVALALAASVLATAHSPAMGAAADVEKPTRLSGTDRYTTAVKVAEAYVTEVESTAGQPTVDTVILTSGLDEHFGYTLPTPALAKLHSAPVLLTAPDELPSAVATFLARPAITTVYIVGNEDVVSAGVEVDVAAINGVTVNRIADVGTAVDAAAAIAGLVGWSPGSPGEIPGRGRTVLLATGENFADALAAGPLAYRGEHPILLIPQSELPAAVPTFLRDSLTDHVVILGGTAAVSTAVENSVKGLGITTQRWQGTDRFATAIDIAEELLGTDPPQQCFDDSGDIGLAYGWRSPDAIVSGPLLGELCAPLLLTERDALPLTVGEFLRSDDYVVGDTAGKLRITVFGGTAAVGSRAVDSAMRAATLVALGATLEAFDGGCHIAVTFAAPVRTPDATNVANYFYGNAPFRPEEVEGLIDAGNETSTTKAVLTLSGALLETDATVPTGCVTPLQGRDRIGILDGKIQIATGSRRVGRVDYFVAADETPPTLALNAAQGSSKIWIEADEPLRAGDDSVTVVFRRSGISSVSEQVTVPAGVVRFDVAVPTSFGDSLKIGDSISIASSQLRDLAGNAGKAIRRIVTRDTTAPRVSRITVTEPHPVSQASVTLTAGDAQIPGEALKITAKPGTAIDGTVGNEWTIDLDVRSRRPSSWSVTQTTSVQVSATNQHILVVALSSSTDAATIGEVADDLEARRAFNQLFTVERLGLDFDTPIDTGGRKRFAGGASTVDLAVYWTEVARECDVLSNEQARTRLIEIDADGDGATDFALDGFTFGGSDVIFVDGEADGSDSIEPDRAVCDTTTPGVRPGTLVARIQSERSDGLPSTESSAFVRSNAITDLAGNPNLRQVVLRFEGP
ncbi:cell wall-binding repeat-containing protein [Candidatus Poriferisodalis sp.]|uniref:cell wall-binding repeat-containing protein n=1 Tax=Candidatus Poriferisodalis sp. TaxID=3101277 RepID=UPI003B01F6B7